MSHAPADWWPQAVRRPVRHATATHPWAAPPLGWILHVVVGDGSPWHGFDASTAPARKFSHWWVAKDGTCEQYAPSSVTSWAQGAGNGTYWSVETEGFPDQPLTDAQLDTLAALHRWLGVPDQLAVRPGDRGIGTHFMGGAAWGDGRTPHTCPDPAAGLPGPRSHQRADIIRRAQGDDDMRLDKDDIEAVRDAILNVKYGSRNLGQVIGQISTDSAAAAKALAAGAAPGTAGPAAVAHAIVLQLGGELASAVADEIHERMGRKN
jgi:hypothetical protein